MLSNLAVSLFEHERIQTTEAKAKMLRPYAERLITKAKKGDVHNRRQVLSLIEDRDVVHKLFSEIAPRFSDRNGGYTRILKIGPRNGDGAPMALVELLDGDLVTAADEGDDGEAAKRRRGLRSRTKKQESPAAAAPAEDEDATPDEPAEEEPQTDEAPEASAEAEDAETAAEEDATEPAEAEAEQAEAAAEDTPEDAEEPDSKSS